MEKYLLFMFYVWKSVFCVWPGNQIRWRKPLFSLLFIFVLGPFTSRGQTIQMANEHLERLEKSADVATTAFLEYAGDRFLNKKEKEVTRKKNRLFEVIQTEEKRIGNERPFNGQVRLKNGFTNYLAKLKQFPENLVAYSVISMDDYRTGMAQQRKKDFISQLQLLKTSASDLNLEVGKYITMNKLKDFKKGSAMPEKWENVFKIFSYVHQLQVAVLTVGSMDRTFFKLIESDSLEKSESVRISMLQLSASLGSTVKARSPIPTDFSLRESAVNSINLYRQDAFRNFKSVIESRKKEIAFLKKYPNGITSLGKNEALISKYEKEKAQLNSGLSTIRNLIKEIKKERDKHEKAFDEYLNQFLERWTQED